MIPNPDIYGTPESWQNNFYAGGSVQSWTSTLKASRAKVPTWDDSGNYSSSQLRTAVNEGKLKAQTLIDKSICAIGQGASSPFRKFSVYAKIADTEHTSGIVKQIGTATTTGDFNDNVTPVNTFFYESRCPGYDAIYGNRCFCNWRMYIDKDQKYYCWTPDGENGSGSAKNGNFYIAPFTFYETRSFLLQILVYVTNAAYDPEYNPTTEPEGTWRTLDTWKNYYSDHTITGCQLIPRVASSYNDNTHLIGYYKTGYGSSEYTKFGCAIADELKFEIDDGTPINDLANYGITSTGSNADLGVRLFGGITDLYKWSENLKNIAIVPDFISSYIKIGSGNVFPYIRYDEDVYESIMAATACFGVPFTPGKSTGDDASNCLISDDWTDVDLCLPIITDDGIAHGEYTRGTGNLENEYIDLDSVRDKDYDPKKDYDTNTYSNKTNFNSLSSSAAMTRRYVLNAANVEKLGNDLWTICNDLATGGDFEYFDGKLKDEFLTTNPIDSIVSLQRFPFNIPHTFNPNKVAVRLGKTDGSAQGYRSFDPFNQITFAGKSIYPRFGNSFLDYEPYTSYELYVPFCGTIKVKAADLIGHVLNVQMIIDLMTGNCTAYVMADQLVIETLNGSCGVDMQLSGIQTATVAANLYNGILGQQQAKSNMIAQGASALLPSNWVNPVGYAAKGEQAETTYKQATYAIEHTETPVHSIGSASPLLSWVQEFDARLIIYYPEGDVISSAIPPSFRNSALAAFGHLKGFATVDPGKVSNYQMVGKAAFLQGDILAQDIPCTQSERNKIKAFFAEGVYLPPIS